MDTNRSPNLKTVVLLVAVSCFIAPASGDEVFAPTGRYVFDPNASTIVQTGGFAGVHWTYTIEGQFCLIVDTKTESARFEQVDANAVDDSEPPRTQDPNDVFNLVGLTGGVIDETTVEFAGEVADGSSVRLMLTFADNTVCLAGETTPPPNSADFFLFSINATAVRKYAGGTGDPNTPYQIATAEQMNAIGTDPNDWDKHFQLTADIDLAQFDGQEGRPAFNIIAPDTDRDEWEFQGIPFTGVFDGNNCTISNFHYSQQDTSSFQSLVGVGLFGYVADPNAEIKNLRLVDPNVDVPTAWNVGALVGWLVEGTVDNCAAEGGVVSGSTFVGGLLGQIGSHDADMSVACIAVSDSHSNTHVIGTDVVGGLAGGNLGGTVTRCSADAYVSGDFAVGGLLGCNKLGLVTRCYSKGYVNGVKGVGGLFGGTGVCNCFCMSSSVTMDCYSTALVEGRFSVGGLMGYHVGSWLERCYSTGEVRGEEAVGGLIGAGVVKGPRVGVEASFWDTEASGQSTSAAGTGLTTAEMQTAGTFLDASWDFIDETENGTDDIWWIVEGQDYPRLWWERDETPL